MPAGNADGGLETQAELEEELDELEVVLEEELELVEELELELELEDELEEVLEEELELGGVFSKRQNSSHPSPDTVFPSSHSSWPCTRPFPH